MTEPIIIFFLLSVNVQMFVLLQVFLNGTETRVFDFIYISPLVPADLNLFFTFG